LNLNVQQLLRMKETFVASLWIQFRCAILKVFLIIATCLAGAYPEIFLYGTKILGGVLGCFFVKPLAN
jgi:hypothetical protein